MPIKTLLMEVSSSTASQTAVDQVLRTPNTGVLQMGMLKKALDSQKQQADQLLKMLDGKGQNIDMRV